MKKKKKSESRYVYYQPNSKDKNNNYGDCTIRALSKALDITWLDAFDMTIPICRKYQVSNVFNAPAAFRKTFLDILGFSYHSLSVKKGEKRTTVKVFANEHPVGRYILNIANHEVACVDGYYYDTWDCGDSAVYGYFEKRADGNSFSNHVLRDFLEIDSEYDTDEGHVWEIKAYDEILFRVKHAQSFFYLMDEEDGSSYRHLSEGIIHRPIQELMGCVGNMSSDELKRLLDDIR